MKTYTEIIEYINSVIGNGSEQVIALATLSNPENEEIIRPSVRMVCAYYEEGAFYISTDLRKKKTVEISHNSEVGVCGMSWFSFYGNAENLGWVKHESNLKILEKFNAIFDWFKYVGDEDNPNSIIIKVSLSSGTIVHNPESDHAKTYAIDFLKKTIK